MNACLGEMNPEYQIQLKFRNQSREREDTFQASDNKSSKVYKDCVKAVKQNIKDKYTTELELRKIKDAGESGLIELTTDRFKVEDMVLMKA